MKEIYWGRGGVPVRENGVVARIFWGKPLDHSSGPNLVKERGKEGKKGGRLA